MRRVVITGLGAVSCIGNNKAEILDSLRNGRSGIVANEIFKEMGLRSQVFGHCNIDFKDHIDRKVLRFMGGAAAYAYIAMQECIDDAGLEESDVSNVRTGLIAGSGGASSSNVVKAADTLRSRGVRKIGPYGVTKTMGSTVAACLATPFKIKGINYSITSACATSARSVIRPPSVAAARCKIRSPAGNASGSPSARIATYCAVHGPIPGRRTIAATNSPSGCAPTDIRSSSRSTTTAAP